MTSSHHQVKVHGVEKVAEELCCVKSTTGCIFVGYFCCGSELGISNLKVDYLNWSTHPVGIPRWKVGEFRIQKGSH